MFKRFDLNQFDRSSSSENIFRLSEKEDEFSGLCLSQNFEKKCLVLERDYFSKTHCYFQIINDELLISDNLADFTLELEDISAFEIASFIFSSFFTKPYTTFYKNIYRLPVGSCCEVTKSGFHIFYKKQAFVKPDISLIDLLKHSIQNYIAPYVRIAAHVSGGLDSSGLASILKTYYPEKHTHFCAVDAGHDTLSEKVYQDAFQEKFKEKINFYTSETDAVTFLEDYATAFSEPPTTFTLPFLNYNLLKELQAQGYEAIVMGNDGDDVLGHGYEYLDILIKNQNVPALKLAFKNIAQSGALSVKYPEWELFSESKKYNLGLLFFLSRHRVSSGIGTFRVLVLLSKLCFGLGGFGTRLQQMLNGKLTYFKTRKYSDLKSVLGSVETPEPSQLHITSDTFKEQTAVSEIQMGSNHFFYNLSKLVGVKILSPFQDLELLSYCENVPLKEKFGDGYGRAFYRNELTGILPDRIRTRIHKTTFDNWVIESIKKLLIQSQQSDFSPLLFKFVKQSFVNDTISTFQNAKDGSQTQKSLAMRVFRIISVNIWLLSFSKNEKT